MGNSFEQNMPSKLKKNESFMELGQPTILKDWTGGKIYE